MRRRKKPGKLSEQMIRRASAPKSELEELDGNMEMMISAGSTLLDLAISGGRKRGGGFPAGILVEIFGPSGSGKTVLLSEIAGAVQRQGGEVMFCDPEGRLNKHFAELFDLNIAKMDYTRPDTVPQVFTGVRKWEPESDDKINGIFADSLAALSTDLEMENEDGDKMGMRRAKEFSEEMRKTCRILAEKNFLMVCSNQIRQSGEKFGPKYKSPGGEAIGFYSSLRLRTSSPTKIKKTILHKGKEYTTIIGVTIEIEVFKNSVWKPYHTAPLTILFDYGIDDIRENLKYIKFVNKHPVYYVEDIKLDKGLDKSILIIERGSLEDKLKGQVIDTWEEIESKFDTKRKPKRR